MNRDKRIVIYTTSDFPYGMAPENLVRQLALGLYENNYNVTIIKLKGSRYKTKNDLKTKIKSKNFIFKVYPKNELMKVLEHIMSFLYSPISVIRECVFLKSDLIILYGTEYPYRTIPFALTARIFRKKIIRVITDRYKKSVVAPVWWKQPKYYLYKLQQNKIDHIFHKLVFLSTNLMNDYALNGFKRKDLITTPHFVDINQFEMNGQSKNQIFTIGFCGTTRVDNGIIDLLEAFRKLLDTGSQYMLMIIGSSTKTIESFIQDNFNTKERKYITITGFQDKSEIPKLLHSCHVLVNPRKSGAFAEAGFPTKLGEYFATKIPVVSTKTKDFVEYFSDKEELILVPSNCPSEIARGIVFLAENPKISSSIGIRGYQWANENLNYIKNAKKIVDFTIKK